MLAGITEKRSPIANKRKRKLFSTGNKFWREGKRGGKKFEERDIKNIVYL